MYTTLSRYDPLTSNGNKGWSPVLEFYSSTGNNTHLTNEDNCIQQRFKLKNNNQISSLQATLGNTLGICYNEHLFCTKLHRWNHESPQVTTFSTAKHFSSPVLKIRSCIFPEFYTDSCAQRLFWDNLFVGYDQGERWSFWNVNTAMDR